MLFELERQRIGAATDSIVSQRSPTSRCKETTGFTSEVTEGTNTEYVLRSFDSKVNGREGRLELMTMELKQPFGWRLRPMLPCPEAPYHLRVPTTGAAGARRVAEGDTKGLEPLKHKEIMHS